MDERRVSRKVRRWPLAGIASISIAVLLLPACEALPGARSPGSTEAPMASAVQPPMLENVPLPSGFQLVDDRSVGTSSGQFRVAKYEFVGKSARARLERFYREYMPSGGWTLISEDLYRGIYEMRFESDTEACIVCLRPEGRNTVINIDVRPLPKGSAERKVQLPVRKP